MLVVNRPSAMAECASKPRQLEPIGQAGFAVPETLVTTDPLAVRAFWELHHGEVVYKSISGIRSRVARLAAEQLERLQDVTFCPTQFQRYIAGRDHRVHVVGNEVFACEVVAAVDDYRYPNGQLVEMRRVRLPDDVEEKCRALAARLGLAVAGIDLRRTPKGEWYCFEINPSPAFSYYEARTGQPIGRAIARLLAGGPKERAAPPSTASVIATR